MVSSQASNVVSTFIFTFLLALTFVSAQDATAGSGPEGCQWAGVNIAGFDFGCEIDGTCDPSKVSPPLIGVPGGSGDGAAQMQQYVTKDKFNIFRLPVGWQYLSSTPGAVNQAQNAALFDKLMSACLKTGAKCIIDIHNYARWDGEIIGQGGPSADSFAQLWASLTKRYATGDNNEQVLYGLVNEPHEVDINTWAKTCQAAVNAIRNAGGKGWILLPGNMYTAAGASMDSIPALSTIKNPDGTTDGLIFDFHNYFDSDNSGTHTSCASNKIQKGFEPPLAWLRQNKRQALVSEIGGGGSDPSCMTMICQALDFLNQNSDVYLGWMAWGGGAFKDDYILVLEKGGQQVPLMNQCFAGKFKGQGQLAAGNGTDFDTTTGGDGATGTQTGAGAEVSLGAGGVSAGLNVNEGGEGSGFKPASSFLEEQNGRSGKTSCKRRKNKKRRGMKKHKRVVVKDKRRVVASL